MGSLLNPSGFQSPFAVFTRADFAQKLPGVNAEVVVVVPLKLDGVFADAFGGERFGCGFEHGQGAGSEFGRLSAAASGLGALFFAHGTGAGVAEEDERVVGRVAVGPLYVDTGAAREIHLHRLWVSCRGGSLKRGLHEFSIAQEELRLGEG